jgi:hypothetical protein
MKNIVSFLLIAGLLLSCNEHTKLQKGRNGIDQLEAELKSSNKDLGYEGCAVLVYPIEYSMPDGTTIKVNKEDEVKQKLGEWYQKNPDSRQRPIMGYPVQMTFNGNSYTVENDSEMRRVRKACNDKKRTYIEKHKEELMQILLDKGLEKKKVEAVVGLIVRALEDAKGKGQSYQLNDRQKQYLMNNLELTEDQAETIRLLIIRMAKE